MPKNAATVTSQKISLNGFQINFHHEYTEYLFNFRLNFQGASHVQHLGVEPGYVREDVREVPPEVRDDVAQPGGESVGAHVALPRRRINCEARARGDQKRNHLRMHI